MEFKVKHSKIFFKLAPKIWLLRFVYRVTIRRKNLAIFLILFFFIILWINLKIAVLFVVIMLILTIYDYIDYRKSFEKYVVEIISYSYTSNKSEFLIKINEEIVFDYQTSAFIINFNDIIEVLHGKYGIYRFATFLIKSTHSYITICSDQFRDDTEYNNLIFIFNKKLKLTGKS